MHFSPQKEMHYFNILAGKDAAILKHRRSVRASLATKVRNSTGQARQIALTKQIRQDRLIAMHTLPCAAHTRYFAALLEQYSGQPLIGDFTPAYATLGRHDFAKMAKIGEAKFVFVMRDPVDRLWSQVRMAVSHQTDGQQHSDGETFLATCAERAENLIMDGKIPDIQRADYRRTVRELERAVPTNRIIFLFFETLFSPSTLEKLCHFAGLDPLTTYAPMRSNRGRSASIPFETQRALRKALAPQYRFAHRRFGHQVPQSWLM